MSAGELQIVPKSEKLVVQDAGPASYLFDTARFEHCYRIAVQMARSSLLPDHLVIHGKTKQPLHPNQIEANCFMILNQAVRWQIDPFALPAETYVVANKLGFQGKLVAAVINARAGLAKPLSVLYSSGKGDDLAAVVFGSTEEIPPSAREHLKKYCEAEDREALNELALNGIQAIRITVGQAKTDNTMWRKDPEQKLFYTGATKWARRHRPEIMLGVLTEDDLERIEFTSPRLQQDKSLEHLTTRLEAPKGSNTRDSHEVVEGAWELFDAGMAATDTVEAANAAYEEWFGGGNANIYDWSPDQERQAKERLEDRIADIQKRLSQESSASVDPVEWQQFITALNAADGMRDAGSVGDYWAEKIPSRKKEIEELVADRKEAIRQSRGTNSNKSQKELGVT